VTQPAAAGSASGASAAVAGAVTVDVLANRVTAIYAQAEQDLLAALAVIASHGMQDRAGNAEAAMLAAMRRAAQQTATKLRLEAGPLAQQIARVAAQQGDTAAVRALRDAVAGHPALAKVYLPRIAGASGQGVSAAAQIALELAGRLDDVTYRIVRFADDAYRAAVADAATRLVLGREGLTPHTAQGLAWRELTRKGVTGFTDTRGRSWNLSTYVETATRTATQRAYNAAHDARMTALGIQFFTVPHDGHPCPQCKPWEGAVLSHGATGDVPSNHAVTGAPISTHVDGTVDQARAEGLFHPNCRHVLVAYFPGVTKTRRAEWTKADAAAYTATQTLRRLEREVRAAKREQAAALDDLARQRAARRVRALQAHIRLHVDHTGLVRRRNREQVDLGHR
jgi:hypothetical protein